MRTSPARLRTVAAATVAATTAAVSVAIAGGVPVNVTTDPRVDLTKGGHPVVSAPLDTRTVADFLGDSTGVGPRGISPTDPFPTLVPLATGPFVNFESPMVKPVAIGPGNLLYVTNTPNGSLTIIERPAPFDLRMRILAEIPVGIDPVTVAARPGTAEAWTANYISDDITVVDVLSRQVTRIIDVGDKPSNIVFTPDGSFAFVLTEGQVPNAALEHTPFLTTIDSNTGAILNTFALPVKKPRGMRWQPDARRLLISAVHSGNNTTSVGERAIRNFVDGSSDTISTLEVMRDFSVTATAFANSPLAPYPDVGGVANAPRVHRIVRDAGQAGAWTALVSLLADDTGTLLPGLAAQYDAEFGTINGADILQGVVVNAPDTLNNDVLIINAADPSNPQIETIVDGAGTTMTGMAIHPSEERLFISNLEPFNLVRHNVNLNGNFMRHEVVIVDNFTNPEVRRINLNPVSPQSPTGLVAPEASLANPIDIEVTADGQRAFVTAFGPGRIGVLNGNTGRIEGRVDVGRGPRGLAIDDETQSLYVVNRTDMTVMRLNIASTVPEVTETLYLFNPEPAVVKDGRDFLYSTNHSLDGTSSCALCHIDGHLDHLAWDLGDPNATQLQPSPPFINGDPPGQANHPLKGAMVTQSLRGLLDHNPFHWRGDKIEFVDFNEAFANLLGGEELSNEDMAAYDAFVKTMVYPPNYYYERNNAPKSLNTLNGAVVFLNNCNPCHTLTHDGASRQFDFDADEGMNLGGLLAQIQLVTQLRGLNEKFDSDLYSGFGLIHDGRERRKTFDHPIEAFVDEFFPGITGQNTQDLIDFLNAFPTNVTNVVGWEVIVDGPTDPNVADVSTMVNEAFAGPQRCDVVATTIVDGERTSWLLDIFTDVNPPQWLADDGTVSNESDIIDNIQPGGQVIFRAVPPGSGNRIALDADQDGTLNQLDTLPFSTPDVDCNGVVDILDLLQMLAWWFEGAPQSDYNFDSIYPHINDLLAFLADWFLLTGE